MIPSLPLDVLAGYTVTREGPHVYRLTPIERTATMVTRPACPECGSPDPVKRKVHALDGRECGNAWHAPRDESDAYATRAEWREAPQ